MNNLVPRGSLLPVFKSRRFVTFVLYLYSLFFYSQCIPHFGGLCCKISGKYNSPFYFCFRSLFFPSLILAISIFCSKICKWEYLSSEIARVPFPLVFEPSQLAPNTAAKRPCMRHVEHFRSLFQSHPSQIKVSRALGFILCTACGSLVLLHAARVFDYL